ncbi:MAG TPA: SET domain-containing protein [Opitutaceae bacterium]|nr:SET domain-containing protein [Opitutaceae bacterium]
MVNINSFANALLDSPFLETILAAELRPSLIAGNGLFTLRPRAAGEIVCILDGQVIDPRRHQKVMEELEWNALSPTQLLVRPIRTSYGYINHSFTPNLTIDDSGRNVRALVMIKKDEELTLDYFAQPVPPEYLRSAEAKRLRMQ